MNENQYNNYEDEREVDLVDMMFYLLKQWRTLLLAIVIGAVLGAGLYVVKNHQQQAEQEAKATELLEADENEEFDEKDYKISKDTKMNMDIAYQYRQLYNKQLEYNQKSIIMQLDPNEVYSGELKYYISAGNNTGLFSVLYQNALNDEAVLEELRDASGLKCDTQYIKELFNSWTADENAASINITNSQDTNSISAVAKHSFVTYQVISTSQKSCEQMLQVIREKADELQTECEEQYGAYSVIEVGDTVSRVTDNTYLNAQRTNVDRLNDYLNAMKNAESNFDDKEKTYYNKKYLAKEYMENIDTENGKDLILDELKAEPVSKVKWLAIGVILLIMIWGAYYVIKYLMDTRVKTVSELQNTYHLPIIGRVQTEENRSKGIDRMLDQLFRKTKVSSDTYEYVVQAVNSMELKKAVLCGNTDISEAHELMQRLTADCERLEMGEFSSKDAESLEKAKAAGNEILVVCIGKTRCNEIERELENCALQSIKIVGMLAIENN